MLKKDAASIKARKAQNHPRIPVSVLGWIIPGSRSLGFAGSFFSTKHRLFKLRTVESWLKHFVDILSQRSTEIKKKLSWAALLFKVVENVDVGGHKLYLSDCSMAQHLDDAW